MSTTLSWHIHHHHCCGRCCWWSCGWWSCWWRRSWPGTNISRVRGDALIQTTTSTLVSQPQRKFTFWRTWTLRRKTIWTSSKSSMPHIYFTWLLVVTTSFYEFHLILVRICIALTRVQNKGDTEQFDCEVIIVTVVSTVNTHCYTSGLPCRHIWHPSVWPEMTGHIYWKQELMAVFPRDLCWGLGLDYLKGVFAIHLLNKSRELQV